MHSVVSSGVPSSNFSQIAVKKNYNDIELAISISWAIGPLFPASAFWQLFP